MLNIPFINVSTRPSHSRQKVFSLLSIIDKKAKKIVDEVFRWKKVKLWKLIIIDFPFLDASVACRDN